MLLSVLSVPALPLAKTLSQVLNTVQAVIAQGPRDKAGPPAVTQLEEV